MVSPALRGALLRNTRNLAQWVHPCLLIRAGGNWVKIGIRECHKGVNLPPFPPEMVPGLLSIATFLLTYLRRHHKAKDILRQLVGFNDVLQHQMAMIP